MVFHRELNIQEKAYFIRFKFDISYSLFYNKVKDDTNYDPINIKNIICNISIPNTSICICDYGDECDAIVRFKNLDYAYLEYQSSCLSFDNNDAEYKIQIAHNFEDLYEHCLTNDARSNYDRYIKVVNKYTQNLKDYLIPEIIDIFVNYIDRLDDYYYYQYLDTRRKVRGNISYEDFVNSFEI